MSADTVLHAGRAIPASGRLLAIDTSGETCAAAILDMGSGDLLAFDAPRIGKGHAERLMEILAGVLSAADCGYGDLAAIAVCVGPGSFTGIRVGVAAARGLALALDIPAFGVTSLAASAASVPGGAWDVLVLRDAKRGEVYALLVEDGHAGEPALLSHADLATRFGTGATLRLTGSGARLGAELLAERETQIVGETDEVHPVILARLAMAGETVPPMPLYMRGPDAKPQARAALFENPGMI